jgi:hypothetical protein
LYTLDSFPAVLPLWQQCSSFLQSGESRYDMSEANFIPAMGSEADGVMKPGAKRVV